MAREDGINVLLKVGDGASPESFTTLGGQLSTTLTRAMNAVDVSDKDSYWSKNLAGKRSATVSCNGNAVWPDTTGLARLQTIWEADGETINCQLILNSAGDNYEGPFVITQLDVQGDDGTGTRYSLTLVNADELTYTAGTP